MDTSVPLTQTNRNPGGPARAFLRSYASFVTWTHVEGVVSMVKPSRCTI